MPMRLGELVLVIRTQDYASRNLNRLSANLGKLSKTQQLQRRIQMQGIRADRLIGRQDTLQRDIGLLRQRLGVESALAQVGYQRASAAKRLADLEKRSTSKGMLRGPGTMGFMGKAAPVIIPARRALASLTKEEEALRATHANLTKQIAESSPALARMNTSQSVGQLRALRKELGLTGRQLAITQADIAHTQEAINRLKWDNVHKMGQGFSRAGRVMQLAGGIGVGAMALMGNQAASFSASATLAATQARNLSKSVGGGAGGVNEVMAKSAVIQKAVLDQMQKYPVSASEMTNATYAIFSSLDLMNKKGIVNVNKGLKLLEMSNKAAVAGGVSLDDSIQGIILTLNNFDPQLNNVTGTLDTMFDIVRFGNIRFADLTTIMGKVAPAAKAVGFTLEDVAGALAQATRTLPVGTVASGFSQLMRVFGDRNFQEGIRVASKMRLGKVLDIAPAGKLEKPLTILRDLLTIFPELATGGKETASFFKDVTRAGKFALTGKATEGKEFTIQIRRVFEALVQNFGSVEELQKAILANNGELEASFQAMLKDPGVQWKIFLSQMQALALTIGTLALPALLTLADGIQRLVNWFRNLSPQTQKLIVDIGVFGSAALLAAGVISSLIGSILSLVGSMGLIGKGLPILTTLARAVGFLAGIGAIALIIKTGITGDASAWEFIQGAMLGAAAGSIFGPAGAIIGGITVPVMMQFMKTRARTPVQQAFDEFQQKRGGNPSAFEALKKVIGGDVGAATKYIDNAGVTVDLTREQFQAQWGKLISMTKSGKSIADAVGINPGVISLFKKYKGSIKGLKNEKPGQSISEILKGSMNAGKLKVITNLWDDYQKKIGTSTGAATQAVKDHAEAVKQANDNMEQTVKTATTNLINQYETLDAANRTALGGLFQGPTMSGVLGSVFKNINDNLRQFGVQIPVPFNILKKDLDQSITYFKQWRQHLNQLIKRGVPYEMLQELQAMGPEGDSILQGLLSAPKGQFRSMVKAYKQGQVLTDKATKEDMARKLKYWNSFGKQAAYQTIMGIINNPKNVKLQKMYENYVKDTYGSILKKTFQDDVAKYMANAITIAKGIAAANNIFPTGPKSPVTGPRAKTGLADLNPRQLTAMYKRNATKINTLMHFVGPLSPIQQKQLTNLRNRRKAILAEYRHDATPAVRRQMRQHQGQANYTVTYEGDKVTVHADGASVASVTRALQKKHFKQKNKHKKGTAAAFKPGPGGG